MTEEKANKNPTSPSLPSGIQAAARATTKGYPSYYPLGFLRKEAGITLQ
jgi:hypothetical protein